MTNQHGFEEDLEAGSDARSFDAGKTENNARNVLAADAGLLFASSNIRRNASDDAAGPAVASLADKAPQPQDKSKELPGLNLSNIDKSIEPGDDFYRFANGKWLDTVTIPDDKVRVSVFNALRDKSAQSTRKIMEEAAAQKDAVPGSNEQKIGDFYASGMNVAKIEAEGAKPILADLARIDKISNMKDFVDAVAQLHMTGNDVVFGFGGQQDRLDSNRVIASAGQGGLGMSRDYYLNDDARSVKLRGDYVAHMEKMFGLLGESPDAARKHARQVMNIETKMAKASMSAEDKRDLSSTYHMMSVAELQKMTPSFSWSRYLSDMNSDKITKLNVSNPEFFKSQERLLSTVPLSDWKSYLSWHLLSASAPYLSSDFVNEDFNFFGKDMQGKLANSPRWERVVGTVDGAMGEAVGQIYVKENFPPEAKARMTGLVGAIKDSLRDSIKNSSWISDQKTRANALEKLDKIRVKVGYPDEWQDYSDLKISRDSYLANVRQANEFAVKQDLATIGYPVDRQEWGMTPQTVNAYYSVNQNEIVFPAAILQPPFFNLAADDATNLGGIGAIIGHEITHGFDDQGSKFDGNGKLHNWWTAADSANFQKRVDALRSQFDAYEVPGGVHLKGKLVSGEAAADLGGVKLSYQALEKLLKDSPRTPDANGFTPEQRFFISFAQVFAGKYRPEALQNLAANDPHPPSNFRVNGTLSNLTEFANAFHLKDNAPILRPPSQRIQLW